jgi:hypothetical protein
MFRAKLNLGDSMKVAAHFSSLGLAWVCACNQPTPPIHAEIKNVSTTCQPTSNYLAPNGTNCTTVAEVVLSGETARQHPWIAYLSRIVDGKEDDAGAALGVFVVEGSGKFTSAFSDRRSDRQGTPQIGFKVLGLQALTPVN